MMTKEIVIIRPDKDLILHEGPTQDSNIFPQKPNHVLTITSLDKDRLLNDFIILAEVRELVDGLPSPQSVSEVYIPFPASTLDKVISVLETAINLNKDTDSMLGPKAYLKLAADIETIFHGSQLIGPASLILFQE